MFFSLYRELIPVLFWLYIARDLPFCYKAGLSCALGTGNYFYYLPPLNFSHKQTEIIITCFNFLKLIIRRKIFFFKNHNMYKTVNLNKLCNDPLWYLFHFRHGRCNDNICTETKWYIWKRLFLILSMLSRRSFFLSYSNSAKELTS